MIQLFSQDNGSAKSVNQEPDAGRQHFHDPLIWNSDCTRGSYNPQIVVRVGQDREHLITHRLDIFRSMEVAAVLHLESTGIVGEQLVAQPA